MVKNRTLGKGLSALISGNKIDFIPNKESANRDLMDIKMLVSGKFQPRKYFNEENINELAESIKKNGIISPIIVREINSEKFEIIAGERRWRASKIAGINKVPVIIRQLSDREALEFAIIENIQRQDLNPVEEANGYQRLIGEFNYTQEQLSHSLGKSRSHISNFIRILTLPVTIKDMISNGEISMGHAKALVASQSPEDLASEIIKNKLSVRDTEKIVRKNNPRNKYNKITMEENHISDKNIDNSLKPSDEPKHFNPDLSQIENSLSSSLGYKVSIKQENDHNKIIIYFGDIEQLDNILERFSKI